MDLLAELQSRIDRLKGLIANRIAYWGEKQYSEYLKNDSFWSRDEEDLKLFMQLKDRLQELPCPICTAEGYAGPTAHSWHNAGHPRPAVDIPETFS